MDLKHRRVVNLYINYPVYQNLMKKEIQSKMK